MTALEILGLIAPRFTRRWLAERTLLKAQQRAYDAATTSQYRTVLTNMTSGDGVMNATGDRLRQISRHLDENHDLTVAVFDDLVNNTVGSGVAVSPMVRRLDGTLAEDMNDALAEAFDEWCQAPETTGELGVETMDGLVTRSWLRDGEIFAQHVTNPTYPYRTGVPYVVELIEADLVPFEYVDASKNILHGIQTNAWNQPVAYYCFKNHPGDPLLGAMTADLKVIPAEAVMHVKFTRRLRQRRGVPILHSVINRMRDIKDYEESERIAAKVAADLTGFIERTSEYTAAVDVNSAGNRALQLTAGAIFELLPGEKVGTIKSDRPNTALVTFREAMLRAVAGGTGTRFSSIARNYNGTYSAQRQELVEGAIAYRRLFAYLVRRYRRPMWERFVDMALASGAVRVPLRSIDMRTVRRADFRAPALPWIDPAKEADAYRTLVEAGLESRQEIMRQRGRDPVKVWEELEEEKGSELFASDVETELAFGSTANPPKADEEQEEAA